MPKPTLLYIAADAERSLFLGVTKDPEIALMQEIARVGRPLTIVYREQHPTMLSALARLKKLRRLNQARRRGLVTRTNPQWTALFSPSTIEVAADLPAHPSEREDEEPEGGPGVPAGRPIQPRPRAATDAKG